MKIDDRLVASLHPWRW